MEGVALLSAKLMFSINCSLSCCLYLVVKKINSNANCLFIWTESHAFIWISTDALNANYNEKYSILHINTHAILAVSCLESSFCSHSQGRKLGIPPTQSPLPSPAPLPTSPSALQVLDNLGSLWKLNLTIFSYNLFIKLNVLDETYLIDWL